MISSNRTYLKPYQHLGDIAKDFKIKIPTSKYDTNTSFTIYIPDGIFIKHKSIELLQNLNFWFDNKLLAEIVYQAYKSYKGSLKIIFSNPKEIGALADFTRHLARIRIAKSTIYNIASLINCILFELSNATNQNILKTKMTLYIDSESYALAKEIAEQLTQIKLVKVYRTGIKYNNWPLYLLDNINQDINFNLIKLKQRSIYHNGHSHFSYYKLQHLQFRLFYNFKNLSQNIEIFDVGILEDSKSSESSESEISLCGIKHLELAKMITKSNNYKDTILCSKFISLSYEYMSLKTKLREYKYYLSFHQNKFEESKKFKNPFEIPRLIRYHDNQITLYNKLIENINRQLAIIYNKCNITNKNDKNLIELKKFSNNIYNIISELQNSNNFMLESKQSCFYANKSILESIKCFSNLSPIWTKQITINEKYFDKINVNKLNIDKINIIDILKIENLIVTKYKETINETQLNFRNTLEKSYNSKLHTLNLFKKLIIESVKVCPKTNSYSSNK